MSRSSSVFHIVCPGEGRSEWGPAGSGSEDSKFITHLSAINPHGGQRVATLLGVARETVRNWFIPNGQKAKGNKPKPDARLANGLRLIPEAVKGVNLVPMRG